MKRTMMKKWFAAWLCLALAFSMAAAFPAYAEGKSLSVVATVFPVWDWTREIVGGAEGVNLMLLMENGVDMHSFQPGVSDMMAIASCDVFIYIGGESDEWVKDALAESVNPDLVAVNLMEALGSDAMMEEHPEGMEDSHGEKETEAPEKDEHIWLSLRNAAKLVRVIADALAKADPARAEQYRLNADNYAAKLQDLDGEYARMVAEAPLNTVLFGDRFPFLYLVRDYGLNYFAAFSGCEAETEASFETVIFLAEKVQELGLPAVLVIEGSDGRIAETIASNTAGEAPAVLMMNSMQGVTAADIKNGASYLGIMEQNLEVLRQALTP